MGSPKALVFLRAHLVLLPRRIHFLFCFSKPLDPSRSLDRSLFVIGQLSERHPLGESTLYHQRGAMPLNRVQPVQWAVQCVEDISYVSEWDFSIHFWRGGEYFQELGLHSLLGLLTMPWNCHGTSGHVI